MPTLSGGLPPLVRSVLLDPFADRQSLAWHDGDGLTEQVACDQLKLLVGSGGIAQPKDIRQNAVRMRGLRAADDFLRHIAKRRLRFPSAWLRHWRSAPEAAILIFQSCIGWQLLEGRPDVDHGCKHGQQLDVRVFGHWLLRDRHRSGMLKLDRRLSPSRPGFSARRFEHSRCRWPN